MPRTSQSTWTCPLCQSEVPSDFAVCWSCGASPEGHVDPNFTSQAEDDDARNREPDYEPLQFSLWTLLLITAGVAALFAVVRVLPTGDDKTIRELVNASMFLFACGVAAVIAHRTARKRLALPGQALVDAGIVLLITAVVLNLMKAILRW